MFWLYCVNPPTSLAVLPFHAQVLRGLLLAYEPFVASVFLSSLSSWHCGLSSPATPQGSHKLVGLSTSADLVPFQNVVSVVSPLLVPIPTWLRPHRQSYPDLELHLVEPNENQVVGPQNAPDSNLF